MKCLLQILTLFLHVTHCIVVYSFIDKPNDNVDFVIAITQKQGSKEMNQMKLNFVIK